jgi:hypothetical protein
MILSGRLTFAGKSLDVVCGSSTSEFVLPSVAMISFAERIWMLVRSFDTMGDSMC